MANAGITQFHLAEGKTAQVSDGEITIAYPSGAFQHIPTRLELASSGILKDPSTTFNASVPMSMRSLICGVVPWITS